MASVLEFVGQVSHELAPDAVAVQLFIQSDFPTIANVGVKLFKDNGDGSISQVGQGVVIDTSIGTVLQGDSALLALDGPGRYAVAFQGQAVRVHAGSGVKAGFVLRGSGGELLENFGGPRESEGSTALINGSAFATVLGRGERT